MDKILIHGGHPLSGSIKVSGSKNSALPILAATLLSREPCVVHGVPDLSDTHYMLQILAHLGAQVERASDGKRRGQGPIGGALRCRAQMRACL
jgi:UDP-N-acetylglucosamine 1-carboxyvinyltransferase